MEILPGVGVDQVKIGDSGDGGEEAFFDGVQLTYRFMDDVVADLQARGHACTPSDIGFDFVPGFAVFSMGSRHAQDLDPLAGDDDERAVVEGVSVAPYEHLVSG